MREKYNATKDIPPGLRECANHPGRAAEMEAYDALSPEMRAVVREVAYPVVCSTFGKYLTPKALKRICAEAAKAMHEKTYGK